MKMIKKLKYNCLAILLVLPIMSINASVYTHNQKLVKKYKLNQETTVYLNNKYGKVHISNWEKDSVYVEIMLSIKSSSLSRVQKLKDNIDFDFVQTKYNITANTIFGSSYNSIFSDLRNIAESLVSTENQVIIDYYIKTPMWTNIKIENKYGDIFIDDAEGEVSVNLSNGELMANKLIGPTVIMVSSGGADIHYLEDAKVISNYSDINIKTANKVDISSKSCNLFVDKVNYLKVDSKRDKYYISSVAKTLGDTYFSDINITELKEEISYDMKYGNVGLEKIDKGFSLINIASEYADISLFFDKTTTYNFDMTHFNEVTFYYPKDLSKLQEKLVDEETKEYFVYGKIGPLEATKSKVNLKAYKKCYIRIEHK